MSVAVITQGVIYALSAEFSKQSIYITTKKIFDLLSFFSSSTVHSNKTRELTNVSNLGYRQCIEKYLKDKQIYLKLNAAQEIIRERTDKCESKAVEITCLALEEIISKIHRELETLKILISEHEKKYLYWLRTPAYEAHLEKIGCLMTNDFETCFIWLERSINCSYVRSQ